MTDDTPTGRPDDDEKKNEPRDGEQSETTPGTEPAASADDTPTERFTPGVDDADADTADGTTADDDAATKILPTNGQVPPNPYVPSAPQYVHSPAPFPPEATAPITPATPPGGTVPPKKNHTLLYWLIGIGAVLLIAVIVLLVSLFSGGDDDPTPTAEPTQSATPSEEPTPTPEPTQEPTPTPTVAPPEVSPTFATFSAPTNANCEEGEDEAPLSFSWSSSDAVTAFLGVGTQNAAINPTVSDLPPTATYTDLAYDCSVASQVYTVTLQDQLGSLASRTVTITR